MYSHGVKLPAKVEGETTWNKQCVDIIGPYKIRQIGKDPLIIKSVTIIDPITDWFEIIQCNYNKVMIIENFVDTMLIVRYPCPVYITYYQGG